MHNITSNIHAVVLSYVECIKMIYARILHVLYELVVVCILYYAYHNYDNRWRAFRPAPGIRDTWHSTKQHSMPYLKILNRP